MSQIHIDDHIANRLLGLARQRDCGLDEVLSMLLDHANEHQQLRQRLEERNEYYRLLTENATDMMSAHTPDGVYTYVSPAARHLLGYEPHELIGRSAYDLFHPDDLQAIVASHDHILEAEDVYTVSYRIRHRDGHYIWFETTSRTVRDPHSGAVLSITAASRDITARKTAEQALHQQSARLQAIVDTAVDAIITIDERGIIESVNHAAEDIFGYAAEEMVGQNVGMLMAEDMRRQHHDHMARYQRTGEAHIIGIGREELARRRDGTVFPIYLAISEVSLDDRRLFTGILRDITAQKEAEQALRLSEARAQALLDALPDLVLRVDRDGTLLDYNADERTSGPIAEPGQHISAALPSPVAEQLMEKVTAALDQRQMQTLEFVQAIPGRGDVHFEVRLVVTGADEVVAILRDVTERQLAMEVTMERERGRILSNFIRDASHEFKTPLSVIQTYLYLLDAETDPDRRRQRVDKITEMTGHIAALVEALTTMSRLDTLSRLELSETDVNMVIEIAARQTPQQVDLHLAPDLPRLQANPHELSRALREIIGNAVRFSHEAVAVQTGQDNDHLWVAVRDYGAGIAPDTLPHIFERFYRGDAAHSTRGFGLGLPIAQKIIELHGGSITIESEPGHGTLVTVALPLNPSA